LRSFSGEKKLHFREIKTALLWIPIKPQSHVLPRCPGVFSKNDKVIVVVVVVFCCCFFVVFFFVLFARFLSNPFLFSSGK